ncbi:subtilisin-like serine endopeptidase family protein [Actinidia rufa]|uniref:Subtilisin-like serine endopeptidase family protein n=1 Tax=Actinidia rufa TaxID=165716 RepID=A0A7J0FSN3_9ERIC|nr:subtilisin-like serine endopeptidase family protein [Actinidia rufa]
MGTILQTLLGDIKIDTATPIRLYDMVTNDLGTYLGNATGAIVRDKIYMMTRVGRWHERLSAFKSTPLNWLDKSMCLDNSLVEGKIVACDKFEGICEVLRVKALGAIPVDDHMDYPHLLPLHATVLSTQEGNKLKSYKNSTKGPIAVIKDIIKSFQLFGIPKVHDKLSVNSSLASWTSMSCPLAAAAAAYVKTFTPQWSPSAIKSALMTTSARPMRAIKNPDPGFACGAGILDPARAMNPG